MTYTDLVGLEHWSDDELLAALNVGAGEHAIIIELRRRAEIDMEDATAYVIQLLEVLPPHSKEVHEAYAMLLELIETVALADTAFGEPLPPDSFISGSAGVLAPCGGKSQADDGKR